MHALQRLTLLASLVLAASCTGLGTSYSVQVDAIRSRDAAPAQRYVLRPADGRIGEHDLLFQEFARCLERALARRGMQRVEDPSRAEALVLLGYGIGEPVENQQTRSVPRYGQTGISAVTTYGTAQSYGGGTTTYQQTESYTPVYGVTGYDTVVDTWTTYHRSCDVVALPLGADGRPLDGRPLWRTTVDSTGSSGDLRAVFPVLVAAAMPYLGESTGRAVTVTLTGDEEAVAFVRGDV